MFPGFSFTYRRWAKNFKPADHLFFGRDEVGQARHSK